MTTLIFREERPMTEADFFAIAESPDSVELFDGSLFVSPAPNLRHQKIAHRLAVALDKAAEAVNLQTLETVNLRLRPNRITIPDLVIITNEVDMERVMVDAEAVRLVCEITSPSNAAVDRVLKMHYYAEAGIPWYLLVAQDTGTVRLYRLTGSTYSEHAVAEPGQALQLTEPVAAVIEPAELLPPR
jgi:Uma2 family endonuclease